MATKAFEKFKASLVANPVYFWDNGDISNMKTQTRCHAHRDTDKKYKKLTPREAWNYNFNCDKCGWPRSA